MSLSKGLQSVIFATTVGIAVQATALADSGPNVSCEYGSVCTQQDSEGTCTKTRCKTQKEKEKADAEQADCERKVAEADKKAGGKGKPRAALECER